jgi:hypothetical protein
MITKNRLILPSWSVPRCHSLAYKGINLRLHLKNLGLRLQRALIEHRHHWLHRVPGMLSTGGDVSDQRDIYILVSAALQRNMCGLYVMGPGAKHDLGYADCCAAHLDFWPRFGGELFGLRRQVGQTLSFRPRTSDATATAFRGRPGRPVDGRALSN